MNIEDTKNKINVLYGYHSDRIEEQVLFTMLNQSPYIIKSATQKQDVIKVVQFEKIDIALISSHIPYMNPYDICNQIVEKHAIPVFMLVSSPECVDIPKAFARGVSDIIVSPYIKPLVFARIENYYRLNQLEKTSERKITSKIVKLKTDTASQKSPPKHYHFKDTNILLAEDNEVNQQLMKNILTQGGIHVEIVQNGQAAVDNIKDALENSKPLYDLILMDLQMPVLDGFSSSLAIREIVEKFQKPEIPIIAITAHTSVHSREKCLRSGMVDFIPKPIDPETCLEVLSQWIHSDKTSLADINCVCLENDKSHVKIGHIPEINYKMGLKRAAGNEVLFKKMLLEFYKEYHDIVQFIEKLLADGNLDQLKIMAHTFKGLGGNIGAENLQKNAFLLEQAIKQNIETDIRESLSNLAQTLDKLIHGIKQNMEWLKQTDEHKISINNETDVKALTKAFQNLDELLDKGRPSSIDTFHELASQIPESMKQESKSLETLILAYDFDNAQTCLQKMIDRLSLK